MSKEHSEEMRRHYTAEVISHYILEAYYLLNEGNMPEFNKMGVDADIAKALCTMPALLMTDICSELNDLVTIKIDNERIREVMRQQNQKKH